MIVTIAIPVFNGGEYIRDAIQSVLNQTFKDFELLIINDGSTDNSMEIAQLYNDKRIKIINDGKNRGLVYRLNQSVELAKGKYYARMDADDIMHPDRIQRQIDYLTVNPEIDVVGTAIYSIDAHNVIKGAYEACEHFKNMEIPGFVHPSVMGKTSWFRQNMYDARYLRAEDLELWLRTRGQSKFANINEQLMYYREFGVLSMRKYYLSKKTEIRIFSTPAKYRIPRIFAIKRVARAILQILVFSLALLLGMQALIIGMRKRKPVYYDYSNAQKNIEKSLLINNEV